MRIFFLILLTTGFHVFGIAQKNPFANVQLQSFETIRKNKIHKIIGKEYDFHADSLVTVTPTPQKPQKTIQSVEVFDKSGRLIEKVNVWAYSDHGDVKRQFEYDSLDRIIVYKQFLHDTLERTESFTYNEMGNISTWKVVLAKNKKQQIIKHYNYDFYQNIQDTKVTVDDQVVQKERYSYELDSTGRPLIERTYDGNNKMIDSIVYVYNRKDTLWKKKVYIARRLEYIDVMLHRNNTHIERRESYASGDLIGVNYKVYDANNDIKEDKSIHFYPELNHTKLWYYDAEKRVLQKKIYRNRRVPEFIVDYELEFYP